MNAPKSITANWRTQYLLTINSDYGAPAGAGWYGEGTTATISVEPVQGSVIRHIFDGWSGDLTSSTASASVTMNAPKVITANWHTDYMQLYIIIIVAAVVIAIVVVVVLLARRQGGYRKFFRKQWQGIKKAGNWLRQFFVKQWRRLKQVGHWLRHLRHTRKQK